MSKFDFEEQRCSASARIREMKIKTPFIFPEWQRVQQAMDRLREASKELANAQSAWERLGQE
jgi:hypothetical protein